MTASAAAPAASSPTTVPAASFTFSPSAVQASSAAHGTSAASSNGQNSHGDKSAATSSPAVTPPGVLGGSFLGFLRSELLLDDSAPALDGGSAADAPAQLVYNFLILPWYLEKLFTLGCLICTDCFLHLFTVLPLRCACAIFALLRHFVTAIFCCCFGRRRRGASASTSASSPNGAIPPPRWIHVLSAAQLCDLTRGLLLATCWAGLAFINMSRMYHYIRGQSVLKLYVIFNMLQISDKLFCSFGEDILESLFTSIVTLATTFSSTSLQGQLSPSVTTTSGKSNVGSHHRARAPPSSKWLQFLHVCFHFSISALYVFGHSLLLFAQVITLNVSVNSDNSSLFVVLVSNNFIELKGSVFKRFDHHNLMQISAADIVERFQLTIFLGVILIQNLSHLGLVAALDGDWLSRAGWMCFMVLGGEWGVDWIKHGFITKFNSIPPIVYKHFGKVLCTDYIHSFKHKTQASIHSVSRRLGLPSLPIAVLVVRVVYQAFVHSGSPLSIKGSLLLVSFAALALIKCLLMIGLLGHATRRVVVEPQQAEKAHKEAEKEKAAAMAATAPTTAAMAATHANHSHGHPHASAALMSSGSGRPQLSLPLARHSASPPPATGSLLPPRSPRAHVLSHPIQLVSASSSSSSSSSGSGANLLVAPTPLGAASSTACSPSLFGLREPINAASPLLFVRNGSGNAGSNTSEAAVAALISSSPGLGHMIQPLTPLALEGATSDAGAVAAGSEVVSRILTPREQAGSARRSLFQLPALVASSGVPPTSVLLSAAGGSSLRSPSPTAPSVISAADSELDSSALNESQDTVSETLLDSMQQSGSPLPLSVIVSDAAAVAGTGAGSGSGGPLSTRSNSSSTSDSALTQRFGHLRTPTALERCNSNMSPQPPVTPEPSPTMEEIIEEQQQQLEQEHSGGSNSVTTVTHTVHLQLDTGVGVGGAAHYTTASMPVASAVTSALAAPNSDGGTSARLEQNGGSAIAAGSAAIPIRVYQSPGHFVVPTETLSSEDAQQQLDLSAAGDHSFIAQQQSSQQLGAATTTVLAVPSTSVTLGEGVAGLDVHIYHHHTAPPAGLVPTAVGTSTPATTMLVTSSPPPLNEAGTAATTGTAAGEAAPVAVSYPPTVLTINSSSSASSSAAPAAAGSASGAAAGSSGVAAAPSAATTSAASGSKEKAAPQYDDAAKMEHDLLTVQRYKISAGKAIPV